MSVLPGKEFIMGNLLRKYKVLSIALVALVIFLPACVHRKVVQVGSHKVTVARHGFQKRFYLAETQSGHRFEYGGTSTDGKGLKVLLEGDKITVNGVPGQLRPGDSVLISDDGVAVNSLDYGESERYLRANSTETAAVQN